MPTPPIRVTNREPPAAQVPVAEHAARAPFDWYRQTEPDWPMDSPSVRTKLPPHTESGVLVWSLPRATPGPALSRGDGLPDDYRIIRAAPPPPPTFDDYAPVDPFFGAGSTFGRGNRQILHGDL